jgi:hypothetical protein
MPQEIPRAVLSERFQSVLTGKRVKALAFLTFRFDPGFFEQEVLPVFMDLPLSHAGPVRLLQLEDALRTQINDTAVYYDPRGLNSSRESAKLDIRRIPVLWKTGYFHPKNVLALVEDAEPDESGVRHQSLAVAAMSANLTRAGWWENVECCQIEVVEDGAKCSYREALLELIQRLKQASPTGERHEAIERIRAFLLRTESLSTLTWGNVLRPQLYWGGRSLPDFLEEMIGPCTEGQNLEIISPYFDDMDAKPLVQLIERFKPEETRVFLPRGRDGQALCSERFYKAVKAIPGCHWAKMPKDLLKSGGGDRIGSRTVHAKVYRFFGKNRRFEAIFAGSSNLTAAAHSKGGNFETGFLIDTDPRQTPDWWMAREDRTSESFDPENEAQETEQGNGVALSIRYDWRNGVAEAYWESDQVSPNLDIESAGAALFSLVALPPREWRALEPQTTVKLEALLRSTSFVEVLDADGKATILVQEDGMASKRSLLFVLSAADILRYWALLTPEQRAAFIDQRASELPGIASELMAFAGPLVHDKKTLFDTFAGIFHAFGSLERTVLEAIDTNQDRIAVYRLFGRKYDSLHRLLDRVLDEEKDADQLTRYLILMCAKQLIAQVEKQGPEFAREHKDDLDAIRSRLCALDEIRGHFDFGTADERQQFLEWFEGWFMRRARQEISTA